jgi:hypothetical protein
MISRFGRLASCGLLLACTGCVAVRAPDKVAAAPPVPAPHGAGAAYCREYQQTVIIGGQMQQAFGTTCQQGDGSWKLVEGPSQPPRPPRAVAPAPAYPADPGYPYPGPYIVVPMSHASESSGTSEQNR